MNGQTREQQAGHQRFSTAHFADYQHDALGLQSSVQESCDECAPVAALEEKSGVGRD